MRDAPLSRGHELICKHARGSDQARMAGRYVTHCTLGYARVTECIKLLIRSTEPEQARYLQVVCGKQ